MNYDLDKDGNVILIPDVAPGQSSAHNSANMARIPEPSIDTLNTFRRHLQGLKEGDSLEQEQRKRQELLWGADGPTVAEAYMNGMGAEYNDYAWGIEEQYRDKKNDLYNSDIVNKGIDKYESITQDLGIDKDQSVPRYLRKQQDDALTEYADFEKDQSEAQYRDSMYLAENNGLVPAIASMTGRLTPYVLSTVLPGTLTSLGAKLMPRLHAALPGTLTKNLAPWLGTAAPAGKAYTKEFFDKFLPNYAMNIGLDGALGAINQNTNAYDSMVSSAMMQPLERLVYGSMIKLPDNPNQVIRDKIDVHDMMMKASGKVNSWNPFAGYNFDLNLTQGNRTNSVGEKSREAALSVGQASRQTMKDIDTDRNSQLVRLYKKAAYPEYDYSVDSKYAPDVFDNGWKASFKQHTKDLFETPPAVKEVTIYPSDIEDIKNSLTTKYGDSVFKDNTVKKFYASAISDANKYSSSNLQMGSITADQMMSERDKLKIAMDSMKTAGKHNTAEYAALKDLSDFYLNIFEKADPQFMANQSRAKTDYAFSKALDNGLAKEDGTLHYKRARRYTFPYEYTIGEGANQVKRNVSKDIGDMSFLIDPKGPNARSSTLADNDAVAKLPHNAFVDWLTHPFSTQATLRGAASMVNVVNEDLGDKLFRFYLWDSGIGASPTQAHHFATGMGTGLRGAATGNATVDDAIASNEEAIRLDQEVNKRKKQRK